jgi:hypothetical protein
MRAYAGALWPVLRTAYRDGTLSWVQAEALVPIVWLDHAAPRRAAWIDHARSVTARRLEDEVARGTRTAGSSRPIRGKRVQEPTRGEGGAEPAKRQAETARFLHGAPHGGPPHRRRDLRGPPPPEAPDGLRAAGPPLARYRGDQHISGLA